MVQRIDPESPIAFFEKHTLERGALAASREPQDAEKEWRALAASLTPNLRDAPLLDLVRGVVERAALLIDGACRDTSGNVVPTDLTALSKNLFDNVPSARLATRALLFIRGLGDNYKSWFPDDPTPEAPSFRVHLFFRSIEGLFGPPLLAEGANGSTRTVGNLTVEKGLRFGGSGDDTSRLLELIYCECCGELFFAGMKGARKGGGTTIELLPIDPRLDGLPDNAASQMFEELTARTVWRFLAQIRLGPLPLDRRRTDQRME